MKLLVAVVSVLALTSCGSSDPGEDVDWFKYPDGLQARIDNASCVEKQETFDALADMDEAVRTREGTGTADVLDYVDHSLREAGCY